MPTGARGEGRLEVDGEVYEVLFTNRALAEVEKRTGKTMMQYAEGLQAGAVGIQDVAQLLTVGLEAARRESKAGGKRYTADDVWRIMDTLGFATVAAVVMEAMAAVLAYSGEGEESPPD